jgi:hypothetical protein
VTRSVYSPIHELQRSQLQLSDLAPRLFPTTRIGVMLRNSKRRTGTRHLLHFHSTLKFNSRMARPYSSFCFRIKLLKSVPHIPTG